MAGPTGLEPATSTVTVWRSSQLSYGPFLSFKSPETVPVRYEEGKFPCVKVWNMVLSSMEDFTDSSAEATVEDMDTPFLTISEAAEKTGRSLSTIRRLIKSIADDDAHADRAAIQPTPKEVLAFKKKEENFAWKIREDVLLREFKGALKEAKKETAEARSDILGILQKELDLKNQQIEKQWEVIHSLNDRLREGNILMGSLQKRLVLAAPETSSDVMDASSTPVSSTEAAAKASMKDSTIQSKGIFAWFSR